jgi:predicted PhzF superfamily epimerase YddE/YHI9
MDIIRIFVNEKGEYGNPHCVVIDNEKKLDDQSRQAFATKMGLSETVFVNDNASGNVSIFSPIRQCPFAGSALVGTAWLLNKLNKKPLDFLLSNDVKVPTWQEGGATYIRMAKSILPNWNYEQLSTPAEVEKLTLADTKNKEHMFVWAWIDESAGLVRARTFAFDWGIPEDPANGSGSMRLADSVGKEITVIHGLGSIIHARPVEDGLIEVGGLVSNSPHNTF